MTRRKSMGCRDIQMVVRATEFVSCQITWRRQSVGSAHPLRPGRESTRRAAGPVAAIPAQRGAGRAKPHRPRPRPGPGDRRASWRDGRLRPVRRPAELIHGDAAAGAWCRVEDWLADEVRDQISRGPLPNPSSQSGGNASSVLLVPFTVTLRTP